ncbi:MAG: hypothetical protein KJ787_03805, partial [Gammaproteobacteria bacterium]|nr:hypothetical protein [Gammaproteobacteria bacterium]MBU1972431.1 hypothetical protein [Gammaproteobacteria bacterium]
GVCRQPSSPHCIGSMLPMQCTYHPPKKSFNLATGLPDCWYGYGGQVMPSFIAGGECARPFGRVFGDL